MHAGSGIEEPHRSLSRPLQVPRRPIKSVDCCSIAGNVTLIHESQEQIAADYAAIRALEEAPGALWALEPNGAKHEDFKMLKVKGKSLSFRE